MENRTIETQVRQILASYGIEVCAFLGAEDLHVIQPHLMPEHVKSAAIWLIPYYTGAHPERNVSLYSCLLYTSCYTYVTL